MNKQRNCKESHLNSLSWLRNGGIWDDPSQVARGSWSNFEEDIKKLDDCIRSEVVLKVSQELEERLQDIRIK